MYYSGTQNRAAPVQTQILPRPADDARNVQEDMLSSDSATLDNYDNKNKPNSNTVSNCFVIVLIMKISIGYVIKNHNPFSKYSI